ncbi:glycosyltransferase family 2 protein [Butyrivibrio fibrisolvens]|uniref:glycosyltransferase family 2 protein n=1 Tax=Butyrivibrio fibrisolvens TaxID=831 RepID=UPI0003B459BD|nr:glycosyltransferase family 2 protein [Butyrivibrio fibrisolvens]
MKKILSVAIPCYNSQDYMRHCVETLLSGGDKVEILIIDDGSKDDTLKIAKELEKANPGIVRAIHQENKGHGGAVMTGIREATAPYFKVVDSDDWVGVETFHHILQLLDGFITTGKEVDLLLANYIYDKVGSRRKKVIRYTHALPTDQVIGWDHARHFKKGQYILMHSAIYRTQVLRDSGLDLPEHTFYVDNLFVYKPLPYVKKLYYTDTDLYHYFIGREDQSVNEKVMISRIDQQIRVNKMMLDGTDLRKVEDAHLRKYMYNYAEIITVISSILLIKSGTPENLAKKKELFAWLKENHNYFYKKFMHGIFGPALCLHTHFGRKCQILCYNAANRFFGFS